jgi:hypothetical protein
MPHEFFGIARNRLGVAAAAAALALSLGCGEGGGAGVSKPAATSAPPLESFANKKPTNTGVAGKGPSKRLGVAKGDKSVRGVAPAGAD